MTGIVRHDVGCPGDVIMPGHVTMLSLVERIQAEEVSARGRGGRRAFVGPRERGTVVGGHPDRALGNGVLPGQDVLVGNEGRQLQIRDRNGTPGARGSDEGGLDVRGESLTPEERASASAGVGCKPDAAHAAPTSIAGPKVRGATRDEFRQARRALLQRMGDGAEIGSHVPDCGGDAYAIAVCTS